MRFLVVALGLLAVAGAMVLDKDFENVLITKDVMTDRDLKTKEVMILKLLNHILMPTMYKDVEECARDFTLETMFDKFIKKDVVKTFMETYKRGMLPRGEVFVHTSESHMTEAIKVFHLMYFAKDFDTFIRCCCWLRDRINEGMFVYALTVTVMHREDCRGIVLPAPYEIYPYYFVNSDVIHKAFMMKMKKGVVDPVLMDYYKIMINDKNVCVIDSRKGLRHTLNKAERLTYFTEDIDLNTYWFYFHMDYPTWMTDDLFMVNKERRGEVFMYGMMQLLARYRLERLSHEMCDIKPIMWDRMLKDGYWPKIRLHTGEEMPMRMNDKVIVDEDNAVLMRIIDDMEKLIRQAVLVGKYEMHDGSVLRIKKPEDIEVLCRLVLTNMGFKNDHEKTITLMKFMKRMFNYNQYNFNKYTYVPTALDIVQTNLRDPVFWKIMKRITEIVVLFKKTLPVYTRDELDFPGVRIETLSTDKLVTFIDEYDMDITNALYLDRTEMKKMKPDMIFVARQRRLNHQPFKMTIDVVSDKTTDAIVRVFLGPKYDCMGRLMDLNDKRLDMVEIDSFFYKLETGKNTIVRDSMEMHNVIGDRKWTMKFWEMNKMDMVENGESMTQDVMWHKTRTGFPHRLLLPMGNRRGLELQMFVMITPVRTGMTLSTLDMDAMRSRKTCRFTVCMDTMPLGYPFDRFIDTTRFFTGNMKFLDVRIFHKDMDTANDSKMVDYTDMMMKRDDLTNMDRDMLVRTRYMDPYMRDMDRNRDYDRMMEVERMRV